jgi:3'-phosphoadenosine 5'-phosphosulfate sulfotransferase (PAPS reductase)/FAD synthetase
MIKNKGGKIKVMKKVLDYLDELEAEAVYILREVAGQFDRPALLFSGGKDSICLVNNIVRCYYMTSKANV